MRRSIILKIKICLGLALAMWLPSTAADEVPTNLAFGNLITTPLVVEGLTGDSAGNLYTVGRQPGNGVNCPVWRVNVAAPSLVTVGFIPAPSPTTQCSPSGLTFDEANNLYVADGETIYKLTPSDVAPQPVATPFATGVPGANGVAFDRFGNLWTGDGTTGQGRVWKISPAGVVTQAFRVQPMANEVNLVGGTGGVGRDARTLPPGTITVTPTSRNAANTAGSQSLVANGLQFNRRGDLFIADTARGAMWRADFDRHGNLQSNTECDSTFALEGWKTLCLDNIFVAHPYLDGADGFVLDEHGNMWVSANERNAIVVATRDRKVVEVFRNPPNETTRLRNTGPLETPTSPFLITGKVCTANSDGNRRDNSPNTAGDIGGPGQPRGKISCADLTH